MFVRRTALRELVHPESARGCCKWTMPQAKVNDMSGRSEAQSMGHMGESIYRVLKVLKPRICLVEGRLVGCTREDIKGSQEGLYISHGSAAAGMYRLAERNRAWPK